jgi:hypothetical protein
MAHPYLEQLQNLLRDVEIDDSDVICKHFFSGAAAYRHGVIFASLTPKGLALKFSDPMCADLLRNDFAEPLRYFKNSPVKRGYVLFPEYSKLGSKKLKQYFFESKSGAAQGVS